MLNLPRSSGIWLHPTSLPGRFGTGEMGQEAHRWLEEMRAMGQRVWHMGGIGPVGVSCSPDETLSAFAGNAQFISFDSLRNDGALLPRDLAQMPAFDDSRVDHSQTTEVRSAFLKLAARRFLDQCGHSPLLRQAFDHFCQSESGWLEDHALFLALHEEHEGRPWSQWHDDIARREPDAITAAGARLAMQIEEQKALQFFFHRQWMKLRAKAREMGVLLSCDVSCTIPRDSADAWAHGEIFIPVEESDRLCCDWEGQGERSRAWWLARFAMLTGRVDLARLTDTGGLPGDRLASLREAAGETPFFFSDSAAGDGVAMMKVMQRAFLHEEMNAAHLPESCAQDAVACTGTMNDNTALGLLESCDTEAARHRLIAGSHSGGKSLNWDFIAAVMMSPARLALCQMQEVLGLGAASRMNDPENPANAWSWRFCWDDLTREITGRMLRLARETERF
jgi:4-alpha-glucanotransferase